MIVVSLLVLIVVLLHLRQSRDYTLSAALLIAALTWLAIEIHLLRLLESVFALVGANWVDVVMGMGALILLIVPVIMLYVAVRDQVEARTAEAPVRAPRVRRHSVVLDKFERRVATLIALGYGRTDAEASALQQMKRDLRHTSMKSSARDES